MNYVTPIPPATVPYLQINHTTAAIAKPKHRQNAGNHVPPVKIPNVVSVKPASTRAALA